MKPSVSLAMAKVVVPNINNTVRPVSIMFLANQCLGLFPIIKCFLPSKDFCDFLRGVLVNCRHSSLCLGAECIA